jgi:iron(III) transport system ATP-binding protein
MNAITIKHLKKSYKKATILHDINLTVTAGELFFLLGASGCGKSTLLRCIAGLEKLDSGSIHFGDKEVTHVPTHKREAAMVFQSYALWPHMTVGENVAFGLEERGIRGNELVKQVLDALAGVHLKGFEDRSIDQLSGGQQQRVALARALVVRPKCLLLDEPLSNLDAQLRLEMRSEIRKIVKENELTAVYVTHDQEEALSVADKIAVMEKGEIIQVGSPEDIYRSPQNQRVATFIGITNLIRAKVQDVVSKEENEYVVRAVSDEGSIFQGKATNPTVKPNINDVVDVSIRPEAMIFDDSEDVRNQIHGTVVERIYQGATMLYLIRRHNGKFLQCAQMNPKKIYSAGDLVTLNANKEDVVILNAMEAKKPVLR